MTDWTKVEDAFVADRAEEAGPWRVDIRECERIGLRAAVEEYDRQRRAETDGEILGREMYEILRSLEDMAGLPTSGKAWFDLVDIRKRVLCKTARELVSRYGHLPQEPVVEDGCEVLLRTEWVTVYRRDGREAWCYRYLVEEDRYRWSVGCQPYGSTDAKGAREEAECRARELIKPRMPKWRKATAADVGKLCRIRDEAEGVSLWIEDQQDTLMSVLEFKDEIAFVTRDHGANWTVWPECEVLE